MKYAVIDVGTNNVLFLIAERNEHSLEVLHRDSSISAMGKDMKNDRISVSGIIRTKNILRDNIRFARLFTDKIIIIGTSCSREADNIDEISNWLQKRFNLHYNIISGDEEAFLNGIATFHEFEDLKNILMFDIGGGSTEFTILQNGKIIFTQSIALGIRRLDNRFGRNFEDKLVYVKKILQELNLPSIEGHHLIGIGGTVTSLSAYRFHLQKYKPNLVHKSSLTAAEVNKMLNEFCNMSNDEIAFLMPFDRYRADIITTGTMIVDELLKHFRREEFIISDRGLQFGVLWQDQNEIQKMLGR